MRQQFLDKAVTSDRTVYVNHNDGEESEIIQLMLLPILERTSRGAVCANGHECEFDKLGYSQEALSFQTNVAQ